MNTETIARCGKRLALLGVLSLALATLLALCGLPGPAASSQGGTQPLCGVQQAHAAGKAKLAKGKVKLAKTSYVYNGKARKPAVTVKAKGGKKLKKGRDYTVTYAKGRKAVGAYKVTVKGKGAYKGTVVKTFKVKPGKVTLKAAKAGAGTLTASWGKLKGGVSYQVAYKAVGGSWKYKKVAASKAKLVVSGLGAGTYTVKVRAFKKVKGTTYYGAWSKSKTCTLSAGSGSSAGSSASGDGTAADSGASDDGTSGGGSTGATSDTDTADNDVDGSDVFDDTDGDASDGDGSTGDTGDDADDGDADSGDTGADDGGDGTDGGDGADNDVDTGDGDDDVSEEEVEAELSVDLDGNVLTLVATGEDAVSVYIAAITAITVDGQASSVTVAEDGTIDLSSLSEGVYELVLTATGYLDVTITVGIDETGTIYKVVIDTNADDDDADDDDADDADDDDGDDDDSDDSSSSGSSGGTITESDGSTWTGYY